MKSVNHLFELNKNTGSSHKIISAKARELSAYAKNNEAKAKQQDAENKHKDRLIKQMSTRNYTNPSKK